FENAIVRDQSTSSSDSIREFASFISLERLVTPTDNLKWARPSFMADLYATSGVKPSLNSIRFSRVITSRFSTSNPPLIIHTLKHRNIVIGPNPWSDPRYTVASPASSVRLPTVESTAFQYS